MKKGCKPARRHDCIPPEPGVYWATRQVMHDGKAYGKPYRTILVIAKDGFGHLRAFVPRGSRSFNLNDFYDYSPRLKDPSPLPADDTEVRQ